MIRRNFWEICKRDYKEGAYVFKLYTDELGVVRLREARESPLITSTVN
jgi:hypothetical protein